MSKVRKFVALLARLEAMGVVDPHVAIAERRVLVSGSIVVNPAMLVRSDASIRIRPPSRLRGSRKLREAFDRFAIDPGGRVALDLGASAGGFTQALLDAGAARVYAVDAGFGQLQDSLRVDPRVVNLERTNLGNLSAALVPSAIDVVTVDLSYLSIADALPQLEGLRFAPGAVLIALVKPMFELALAQLPMDAHLERAVVAAWHGCEDAGWQPERTMRSSLGGAGGAVEFFILATRRSVA